MQFFFLVCKFAPTLTPQPHFSQIFPRHLLYACNTISLHSESAVFICFMLSVVKINISSIHVRKCFVFLTSSISAASQFHICHCCYSYFSCVYCTSVFLQHILYIHLHCLHMLPSTAFLPSLFSFQALFSAHLLSFI